MNASADAELAALADDFEAISTVLSGAYADSLTGLALPAAELHSLLAHLLDRAAQAGTENPYPAELVHALTEAAVHGAAAAQQLGRLAAAHGRLGHLAVQQPTPARTAAIHQALAGIEAAQAAVNRDLTTTATQLRGHPARRPPAPLPQQLAVAGVRAAPAPPASRAHRP